MQRFIPADAGNTAPGARLYQQYAVYPRWRGEHASPNNNHVGEHGLSPLARGTLILSPLRTRRWRFIPAGAGNTFSLPAGRREVSVYPRWRGEHGQLTTDVVFRAGLSPLARGTLWPSRYHDPITRFIPAGAGNTSPDELYNWQFTVYPRWRGEHKCRNASLNNHTGLSPLARGTLHHNGWCSSSVRFIPAGAGNTYRNKRRFQKRAVYPRWRGEHINPRGNCRISAGLSPLARGTLRRQPPIPNKNRFIPAGAGNTSSACRLLKLSAVYPRWRGEHNNIAINIYRILGLSPLARGTLGEIAMDGLSNRFIPAGAGNTSLLSA